MPQLNWWEQFTINAAISLLLGYENTVTDPKLKAGLDCTISFLKSLMTGQSQKLAGPVY